MPPLNSEKMNQARSKNGLTIPGTSPVHEQITDQIAEAQLKKNQLTDQISSLAQQMNSPTPVPDIKTSLARALATAIPLAAGGAAGGKLGLGYGAKGASELLAGFQKKDELDAERKRQAAGATLKAKQSELVDTDKFLRDLEKEKRDDVRTLGEEDRALEDKLQFAQMVQPLMMQRAAAGATRFNERPTAGEIKTARELVAANQGIKIIEDVITSLSKFEDGETLKGNAVIDPNSNEANVLAEMKGLAVPLIIADGQDRVSDADVKDKMGQILGGGINSFRTDVGTLKERLRIQQERLRRRADVTNETMSALGNNLSQFRAGQFDYESYGQGGSSTNQASSGPRTKNQFSELRRNLSATAKGIK